MEIFKNESSVDGNSLDYYLQAGFNKNETCYIPRHKSITIESPHITLKSYDPQDTAHYSIVVGTIDTHKQKNGHWIIKSTIAPFKKRPRPVCAKAHHFTTKIRTKNMDLYRWVDGIKKWRKDTTYQSNTLLLDEYTTATAINKGEALAQLKAVIPAHIYAQLLHQKICSSVLIDKPIIEKLNGSHGTLPQ